MIKVIEDEKNVFVKLKVVIDLVGVVIDIVGWCYFELKKFFDKGFIDKEEYEFFVRKFNEIIEELSGVV